MSREEKLKKAYEIQKRSFDEAEIRKITNLRSQYKTLESKKQQIISEMNRIAARVNNPKKFISFEEFSQKCKKP